MTGDEGVFGDGTVYKPAEDSRLLLAAAGDGVGGDDRVLEVGAGSGYVAVGIARRTGARVVATDINPHACRATRERAAEAGVPVATARTDLLGALTADGFDAVACNPPYLPDTPEGPVPETEDWLSVAVSGGRSGRAVIDPFLEDVGRVLRPGGVVYLLVSSLTGVEAVLEHAAANGLAGESVASESYPFETLEVLRLTPE